MEFPGESTTSVAKSLSAHLRLLSLWLALRLCTPPKAARFQLFPFTVARTFICLCAPLDCDRVSFSDTHAGFLFSTAVSIRLKIFRQTPPAETHIVFLRIVFFYAKTNTTYRLFYVPRYPAKAPKVFSAKKKRTRQVFLPSGIFRWVSLSAKFRKCPAPAQSAPVHSFCRLAVLPAAAYVPPVHVPVPAYHRRFLFQDM